MGHVLNVSDFEAARAVQSTKLDELGVAPICLAPGAQVEGHSHTVIEEIVFVQQGVGKIQIEDETFELCSGSVAVVPAGQFHAFCNTGSVNLELVAIYNSNVDRAKVELKSRSEHFGEPDDPAAAMAAEIKSLKKTIKKLKKKKRK